MFVSAFWKIIYLVLFGSFFQSDEHDFSICRWRFPIVGFLPHWIFLRACVCFPVLIIWSLALAFFCLIAKMAFTFYTCGIFLDNCFGSSLAVIWHWWHLGLITFWVRFFQLGTVSLSAPVSLHDFLFFFFFKFHLV